MDAQTEEYLKDILAETRELKQAVDELLNLIDVPLADVMS
jgi:hypothetical protein